MLTVERVPVRHRLADRPVEMPITVLLALPGYVTRAAAPEDLPDPFGALAAVLRGADSVEAAQIVEPRVWAPGWGERELDDLLRSEFWGFRPPESFRVRRTPLDPESLSPREGLAADIVHLVARTELEADVWPSIVVEEDDARRVSVRAGGLRDALLGAGTRLLILHSPPGTAPPPASAVLARTMVEQAGPAVLVVQRSDPAFLQDALGAFYAELAHDRPLSDAVHPFDQATLYIGEGGDGLLQFHPYIESLMRRLADVSEQAGEARRGSVDLETMSSFVHRAHVPRMVEEAGTLEALADEIDADVPEHRTHLEHLANLTWDHESEGLIPLAREIAAVESLGARAGAATERYEALARELEAAASKAPRVLNGNLADPGEGRILDPRDPLQEGRAYELLVDVGPRWDTIPSLVQYAEAFPEEALPPDESGHELDVVLVGESLEQEVVRARIWLPARRGRSHPMGETGPTDEAGPVALPFAPVPRTDGPGREAGPSRAFYELSARLSVLYRGSLLQSAQVSVRVVSGDVGEPPPGENRILQVDFAVSGSLQDLETEFTGRDLTLGGAVDGLPVGATITLNANGSGGHRLVMTCGTGATEPIAAGFAPYNPVGATKLLGRTREALLECFRQGEGRARRVGLDPDNGKRFDEFRRDLRRLARLGRELYAIATAQARSDRGGDPGDFSDELRRALSEPRVIQVGRTILAEYAFPWALVYDIPLPGPHYLFCRVVREWKHDGRRRGADAARCPFADETWHSENIFCPYGFWGLKHVVEQPLSVVDPETGEVEARATPRAVHRPVDRFDVGIAVTTDPALDRTRIGQHFQRLGKIPSCRLLPAPPASDVERVRAMLPDARVVYFLCHGETDAGNGRAYLGIGPRDDDANHKVYAQMVHDWTDTEADPNLKSWRETQPLVIINGCHTTALTPEEVLSFVSAFGFARASGVLGTEVAVLLEVATECAESFLGRVADGEPVGDSLYQMRWELANKGNLLGLAYSLFSRADLRVIASQT